MTKTNPKHRAVCAHTPSTHIVDSFVKEINDRINHLSSEIEALHHKEQERDSLIAVRDNVLAALHHHPIEKLDPPLD